jgi:hypothetical protein
MLSETWEDQYKRIHRSYARLQSAIGEHIDRDPELHDESSSRDILFHFLADALHLKEYIKNEEGQTAAIKTSIEDLFDPDHADGSVALSICADIANGVKHLELKRSRFEPAAEVGKEEAGIRLPVTFPAYVTYHFSIEAGGNTYAEIHVADNAIADWDLWLTATGFSLPALAT